MPVLIAKCGKFAGVDLLPHAHKLGQPAFRILCQEIAEAGVELHNHVNTPKDA